MGEKFFMRVALIRPIRTAVVAAFAGILTAAPSRALEWQKEIVFEGAAKPSLAVGADGLPRIAFLLEAMPGFVAFAQKSDGGWTVDRVASGYFYGPLDILMNGESPVINYHDHDLQGWPGARDGRSVKWPGTAEWSPSRDELG